MAREVERKFVLSDRPGDLEQHPSSSLMQGYLALDPAGAEVRVRRDDGTATLTIKTGEGLVRGEEEIVLEPSVFDALWPLTDGRRTVKRRYRVPLGDGLTAEVDDFADDLAGLLTAEVEFPDEATALAWEPPAWLGREVTGDPRYANRVLAVDGRP
jgi:CYTH domain-containing protein